MFFNEKPMMTTLPVWDPRTMVDPDIANLIPDQSKCTGRNLLGNQSKFIPFQVIQQSSLLKPQPDQPMHVLSALMADGPGSGLRMVMVPNSVRRRESLASNDK